MGQILAVKIIGEKFLDEGRKLFATFMDLEKNYEQVDKKGIIGCFADIFCGTQFPRSGL